MSTVTLPSYPIQQWEKAGGWIAGKLNEAMDEAGKNSDTDKQDFEDSEFMKSWNDENGSLFGGGDDFYYVRVFSESANHWTDKQKCSFGELPELYRKYLFDLREYQTKCWNELVATWNNEYLSKVNSPKVLWDKAELWKSVKASEMDNLLTEVGKMQLQNSWTGAGATAYGNAISVQTEAFNKITQLVEASGGALNDGSSGLQRFYMVIAQCALQITSDVRTVQPTTKEDFGYRTRVAISSFKNAKEYLDGELKDGIETWAGQVNAGTDKIKKAIANERPFQGEQWPKIDGDLSDMKPGPTNPMGMPQTPTMPNPTTTMPDVNTSMPPAGNSGYQSTAANDAGYRQADKLD